MKARLPSPWADPQHWEMSWAPAEAVSKDRVSLQAAPNSLKNIGKRAERDG